MGGWNRNEQTPRYDEKSNGVFFELSGYNTSVKNAVAYSRSQLEDFLNHSMVHETGAKIMFEYVLLNIEEKYDMKIANASAQERRSSNRDNPSEDI
jgi:hypothetical protein